MNELSSQTVQNLLFLTALTLPLKAYSVWKASQNKQLGWFIALFIVNTLGILELIYLFYFSKPTKTKEK